MEFYENRSKRPFIVFVWIGKRSATGIASTVPPHSEPDER
ncbi:protein YjiS [Enterobacter cloacae]|uniref:Protein YjiS n=1 Tax=Enterobacter cloacae TaxID=550 RepID=A0A377M7F1_ENTCL|nr:protein YjiS [Enterobacter cloacae]